MAPPWSRFSLIIMFGKKTALKRYQYGGHPVDMKTAPPWSRFGSTFFFQCKLEICILGISSWTDRWTDRWTNITLQTVVTRILLLPFFYIQLYYLCMKKCWNYLGKQSKLCVIYLNMIPLGGILTWKMYTLLGWHRETPTLSGTKFRIPLVENPILCGTEIGQNGTLAVLA